VRVGDRADLVERLLLELAEAHHDVGHLHAGVVDVVLHLHARAAEPQRADERVAQRGVAEMADVGRLVRVDRRVLDDRLAALAATGRESASALTQERRADRERIEVAVGRRDHLPHAGHRRRGRAISAAMTFGALRSRRASSKATGVPRSPRSRLGGDSRTKDGCAAGVEAIQL
jgi:hypothetical protein